MIISYKKLKREFQIIQKSTVKSTVYYIYRFLNYLKFKELNLIDVYIRVAFIATPKKTFWPQTKFDNTCKFNF